MWTVCDEAQCHLCPRSVAVDHKVTFSVKFEYVLAVPGNVKINKRLLTKFWEPTPGDETNYYTI